jgi:predicted glycoside hydrolase/deacetylase ChbG (UPF0249 family)
MRLLIVNADDYGLTKGVSRAILHAHQQGIVTSTSALAVAPGFKPTVAWLRDTEGIGIGAHLAAVGEDPPLLSALEVPTLVDGQGRLASSWKSFLPRMAARQIDPDDLRLEFAAQIQRLQGAGLPLTHVDTHQHLHLWPGVADVVLDLATQHGIPAVRVTRSSSLSPVGLLVRRLSAGLARRADLHGLRSTAAATGLDQAGRFDGDRMRRAIARLGAGGAATAELGTHPGQPGDADLDRYAWGYRLADELEALTAPATAVAVAEAGFTLGTYADLPAPRSLPGSAVHLATSHLAGPDRPRRHDA